MSFVDKAREMMGSNGEQQVAITLIAGLIQQQGGLPGLLEKFHRSGMGDLARSWVSTGNNLPLNADQVNFVLGSGVVATLANRAGITPGNAAEQIAKLLPQVVDKLTPEGEVPATGSSMATAGLMKVLLDLVPHSGAHA